MNAKEYLESQGIFGLDTKKRYKEVIEWMEAYAQERVKNCSIPAVVGQSEQLKSKKCGMCNKKKEDDGHYCCED